MRNIFSIILTGVLMPVAAQMPPPSEFPQDAVPVSEQLLAEKLSGKTYAGTTAEGKRWRMDFNSSGFLYWNGPWGKAADVGRYTVEGDRLCTTGPQVGPSCNLLRLKDDAIYYKRNSTGEVVKLDLS